MYTPVPVVYYRDSLKGWLEVLRISVKGLIGEPRVLLPLFFIDGVTAEHEIFLRKKFVTRRINWIHSCSCLCRVVLHKRLLRMENSMEILIRFSKEFVRRAPDHGLNRNADNHQLTGVNSIPLAYKFLFVRCRSFYVVYSKRSIGSYHLSLRRFKHFCVVERKS